MSKLYKRLQTCGNEKDVENAWRMAFTEGYPDATITSPLGTDGYLHYKDEKMQINRALTILHEFKYDEDFRKRDNIIKVLIQCLYYLKKHKDANGKIPIITFVGDKNECFSLHNDCLKKYLSHNLDWSIAPSQAAEKNRELFLEMIGDDNILPYVDDVDEKFSFFNNITNRFRNLSDNAGKPPKVIINKKNIDSIFEVYLKKVLKKNSFNPNQLVNIFINSLTRPTENYLHPKKSNTFITKDFGEIKVSGDGCKTFFNYFSSDYSPQEKAEIVATCDRLIEDLTRRFKGEFYTPTIWVDEAHKMISSVFGEDWKEKYVVWDCACGTGNLTRDYKFAELYLSTINESDLGIMEQHNINPEAKKFRMDFLNDDMPGFMQAVIDSGKKILFFINPPYGGAQNRTTDSSHKAGIAKTKTNEEMHADNMGRCSEQLYAQFLYKMMKIKNSNIAIYSKPLFLSGSSFEKFRAKFLDTYEYKKAMLFNAGHFNNVSSIWGVSFSLWKSGKTKNKNDFFYEVKDVEGLDIIKTEEKMIYNLDGKKEASKWVRAPIRGITTEDAPQLSSAININPRGIGKIIKSGLGYMNNAGNSVYTNLQTVGLYSSAFSNAHGSPIIEKNFDRVISLFTARKTIRQNWINDKDEYLAPNEEHKDYKQWNNDCMVYSLFNTSSNQSSLRNIEYKKKIWNIENEWFFMSINEIRQLANDNHNDEIYQDCRSFNKERFVYNKLKETPLSEDANYVLNLAKQLIVKSFPFRKAMHEEYPEYHLNAWDAGWYQIKKILNKYFRAEYNEFVQEYKAFEKRMREGVFMFGFLKE